MQGKKEYMTNEQSAFLHFLIRFTRAIQRNEKGWDALFLYALAGEKMFKNTLELKNF